MGFQVNVGVVVEPSESSASHLRMGIEKIAHMCGRQQDQLPRDRRVI